MVVLLLVGLGVGLVALGVLVLIRYPDRPGGVVRFHGVEVGSKGAGLPLVVLGVALALVAGVTLGAERQETAGGTADPSGSVPSDSAGRPEVPGLDAAPRSDCTDRFFAEAPRVDPARVRSVELDAVDRRVLATGERQDTEFGLVFSDPLSSATPVVLGAMKLSHKQGVGFRVSALVEERTCEPASLELASDPGVPAPAALGDYIWVAFRLDRVRYVLLLNSSNANTEVLVTLHRKT